jgi:hypothetical protein
VKHSLAATERTHKVAPGDGGIRDGEADDLLRVDDEHCTDGERQALEVLVRRVLVVEHVVDVRHLAVGVCNLQGT